MRNKEAKLSKHFSSFFPDFEETEPKNIIIFKEDENLNNISFWKLKKTIPDDTMSLRYRKWEQQNKAKSNDS